MNKHSPLPWAVRPHLPDAHFEVVADTFGNTVGTATRPADAALIVEAVNGRDRDEALIAALLYHHLEDFAEAVASDNFTKVIKAAFLRLGLRYEPFGPDALEAVEKRRNEVHMIKLPVKDPNTIPWMTPREIPAIKAALSAWRNLRRDKSTVRHIHDRASIAGEPQATAELELSEVAWDLEMLTALEERMRKEQGK